MMKNTFLIFKYAQHNFTFNVENEDYDLYGEKTSFHLFGFHVYCYNFYSGLFLL